MRKIILIAVIATTMSCKMLQYNTVPQFDIGMNEVEFIQKAKNAKVASANADGQKIYRASYPRTMDERSYYYHFYFFEKGKLVRYEQSENPDVQKLLHWQH